MPSSNPVKLVNVKRNPRTSIKEAGIYPLDIAEGAKVVALANSYFPHHDRNMMAMLMAYIRDFRPEAIVLLGGMFDMEAFQSLWLNKNTFLHVYPDTEEVARARSQSSFEEQIFDLAKSCGDYLRAFTEYGAKVFYIPSTTSPGMSSEVQLMDAIQIEKERRDKITLRGKEILSDPDVLVPRDFSELFQVQDDVRLGVIHINSTVLLNESTMFIVGDFKRKHPVTAAIEDYELNAYNIVRAAGGKLSSAWQTTAISTFPDLQLRHTQIHEVGKTYDGKRMAQFGDYERRATGFFRGTIIGGTLFGSTVHLIRGLDGRRSFIVDGEIYTETEPGELPRTRRLTIEDYRKPSRTQKECEE